MTEHATHYHRSDSAPGVSSRLRQILRNWQARRKVSNLQDLDDRMLADIGVSRAEVEWAARLPLALNAAHELQSLSARRRKYTRSQR